MEELIKWLNENKIAFIPIDNEVIDIQYVGKCYVVDDKQTTRLFRQNGKGEVEFNLMENPQVLMDEGITVIIFKHGNNIYYYDLLEKFSHSILRNVGKKAPTGQKTEFVNLGVHTPFELLNGSGDIADWVRKAKFLGHTAIGICDKNTMAGTLELQKACKKNGLKHVFGYSFNLSYAGKKIELKLYCQTQEGLQNLLRVQKAIMVDSEDQTIHISDLLRCAEGNILVFGKLTSEWMLDNIEVVRELKKSFDGVYYQFDISEFKANKIDEKVLEATHFFLENFYAAEEKRFLIDPVLICDNYYLDKPDYRNKIILNKIAEGAAHEQSDDQYFKDVDEHYQQLQAVLSAKWDLDWLFQLICGNTVKIANGAEAYFETGKMFMPEYIMLQEEEKKYGSRHIMFLALINEGLQKKIPIHKHSIYQQRLEEEIYIIESTNNVDYFLIQYDMIREAKRRGIATGVGRGSAGGSLVSYLLDIISIDPIQYDLLFSRFLVPERCGLQWTEKTTKLQDEICINKGEKYCEIDLGGFTLRCDIDAQFQITRGTLPRTVYADEIQEGDIIIFDNRDIVWTLNQPS